MAEPVRAGWRNARVGSVVLGCVIALASLSVAAAHWWPASPRAASVGSLSSTHSTDQTRAATAGPADSLPDATPETSPSSADAGAYRLAALLDPTGDANVTLELTFGDARETLHRSDLAALVALDGGQPTLNTAALRELAARLGDEWDQPMVNARFNFNGGDLTPIRQSQQGRTLDETAAASAIGESLLSGQASIALPGSVVPPAVSSDNPEALGITTNLDRGGTSFAGSIPEKAYNIQLAAQRLNGVVIPPGGVFSFNAEVGATTLNAGFKWGFGIEASAGGARTVPSVAGGICQVATTLFQRVFWSGFPLVERHWHLYWIPAYTSRSMVGLDATVDADSGLDFRWSNPTNGYILVQSATDDSNVYFGLYGSPNTWKVNVDQPKITNRVAADPAPVAQPEPTLPWGRILPVEAARDGFDVAITRTVTRADGQPRTLTLESSYEPSKNVTLVGTKDKPADADLGAVLARVAPPVQPTAAASATPSGSASPSGSVTPSTSLTPAASVTALAIGTNAPATGEAVATERPAQATTTPAASTRAVTNLAATSAPASQAIATVTAVRTPAPSTATVAATAVRVAATVTTTPKPVASSSPTATRR